MMRIKTDLELIGLALFILIVVWKESTDDTTFSRTGRGESELHQDQRNKQVTKPDHKQHEHIPVFTGATMFVYWPPPLSGMKRPGKKFTVDLRLAKQIKQMSKHFFVLNEKTVDKFVFVMAASSNHFEETIDAVASVQRHFPGKKLFYYDLGLDHHQIVTVNICSKQTGLFLPTNTTRQMLIPMCIATAMLVYNTKAMFYNVLWWFFLCALQEDCQAPMEKTMCRFDLTNKWATFAECHKWDQSTLNILLSNYFGYDHRKYMTDDEVIAVERWPTHRYTIIAKDD